MALYVISDTHLTAVSEKPMDIFGYRWKNWTEKLCENWNSVVTDADTVVVPGDISWAMTLEEARDDLLLINGLKGRKIIGKGNHDYWWNTLRKNESFFAENGISTVEHLYNNSFLCENKVICGCRGWYYDEKNAPENADYEKIVLREAGRLRLSLESARRYGPDFERLVFFHFPPVFGDFVCRELVDIMKEYGVKRCYYGHIHGEYDIPAQKEFEGIVCTIVSSDYLDFKPLKID